MDMNMKQIHLDTHIHPQQRQRVFLIMTAN